MNHAGLTRMFLEGGWVMWPLLALSVVSVAVAIDRLYAFLAFKPRLFRMTHRLLTGVRTRSLEESIELCADTDPLIRNLAAPLFDATRSEEARARSCERSRARVAAYLKRNLWILGTVGSASPFIGLLGTVVGIIRAFGDMAEKGAGGFAVVAAGISEALIATGAGLIVAIIALFAYNVFTTAANQTLGELKLALDELLDESSGVIAASTSKVK